MNFYFYQSLTFKNISRHKQQSVEFLHKYIYTNRLHVKEKKISSIFVQKTSETISER